jgi:hypothetical protein
MWGNERREYEYRTGGKEAGKEPWLSGVFRPLYSINHILALLEPQLILVTPLWSPARIDPRNNRSV